MTALEILDKLRAAGVEPMDPDDVRLIVSDFFGKRRGAWETPVKLAADLIEACAKLDAVREWARAMIDCAPDTVPYEAVGRDALAILEERKP